MRIVFALPLIAACAPDYSVLEDVEQLQFTEPLSRVEVDVENGSVLLLGRVDDLIDTRVQVTSRWSRLAPTWDATVEDGVLRVVSRCRDQRACATDVHVRVPPAVDAHVESKAGDLEIGGLAGDLDAATRAGAIDLAGFRGGRVDLYAEAGTITTSDVVAPVVIARTEAGAIDLGLDGGLQRVVAETDGGAVRLDVPAGGYRLDLYAEAGAIALEDVFHEPGADGVLRVQTDAGSIEILGH